MADSSKLVTEFDEQMLTIYRRALAETGYKATRFLSMLESKGGVATAKYLIHCTQVSDGYTALWMRKRLDLTVEAMILSHSKWSALFSPEELSTCENRLKEYGFKRDC